MFLELILGSKGWHSGESACLPPMWPRFKSWHGCLLWVEFVCSLLCSKRFFSGYSSFPLVSKTNIPNSNLIRNQADEEPLYGSVTSKSLFIYFLSNIYRVFIYICVSQTCSFLCPGHCSVYLMCGLLVNGLTG